MAPDQAAVQQARFSALDRAEEVVRSAVLEEGIDVRCQIADLIYSIRSETGDGSTPSWDRLANRFIIMGETFEVLADLATKVLHSDHEKSPCACERGLRFAGLLLAKDMRHVDVNGVAVLRDGEHTDARPGRVVRGPGWRGGS